MARTDPPSPRDSGAAGASGRRLAALMACYHEPDIKTIAISIDEASLAAVDRLAQAAGRRRGGRKAANRSEVVRRAVQEFIARQRKHEREEGDRRILGAHRDRIEREAAALVTEQAEP